MHVLPHLLGQARQQLPQLPQHELLRLRIHICLRRRIEHAHAHIAPRAKRLHHRRLVRQRRAAARLHIHRPSVRQHAREDVLEVLLLAAHRGVRRGVVHVHGHVWREDGPVGVGGEEGVDEFDAEGGVEARGERGGGGFVGKGGVGELVAGGGGEGDGGDAFLGGFAGGAAVCVLVRTLLPWKTTCRFHLHSARNLDDGPKVA